MIIKEITTKMARLINIGNYENVTISVEAIAEVEQDETAEECYKKVSQFCKDQINDDTKVIKQKVAQRGNNGK